jgi:hypothetical protein
MSTIRYDIEDSAIHLQVEQTGAHRDTLALADELVPILMASGRGRSGGSLSIGSSSRGVTGGGVTKPYVERMKARRRRDDDEKRRRPPKNPDDYDLVFELKTVSMMAYAIDVTNGQVYVGYSGGGSAVFSRRIGGAGVNRRRARVAPYLAGVHQVTGFDPHNCAEVAALNVALAYGAQIGNLFFISMDTNLQLRDPCGNCLQWLVQAYGYLDGNGTIH